MSITVEKRNKAVKEILNGMHVSIKAIISLKHEISKPQLLKQSINLQFGVLIGVTGDIKGKLVLAGDTSIFAAIGESMFGMPLDGEMLTSFSGELGNMLAGRLSTAIVDKGINTDITSPTIIQGNTNLLGHKQALKVTVTYDDLGEMDVYLLFD